VKTPPFVLPSVPITLRLLEELKFYHLEIYLSDYVFYLNHWEIKVTVFIGYNTNRLPIAIFTTTAGDDDKRPFLVKNDFFFQKFLTERIEDIGGSKLWVLRARQASSWS
jgi:hypothetical protein